MVPSRSQRSHGVNASHDIAGCDGNLSFHQFFDGDLITEKIECLFNAAQVIGAYQHNRWAAISGNDNPFVLALDSINEL